MRKVITRFAMLALVPLIFWQVGASLAAAQTIGLGGTPAATPEAGEPPKFGIVPVGDHPDGYFSDIEAAPGTSTELTVAIVNAGEGPIRLHTYKMNALSAVNGGFMSGEESDEPVGATAWIDYPATDIELDPGEQHTITFTVSVPEGTAPGQYIAGLAAETAEASAIPGSDVLRQVIRQVISVGILVPGEIAPSFELGTPELLERNVTVPLANTGNYLVRPAGELTLTDADGKVAHTSKIEMGSVYSGLSTTVSVRLPEQTPPGDYTVDLSLEDEASGATASIEDAPVTMPEPVDPTGVSATGVTIEPNTDPIAYANVAVTLNNGGQQIPASNVSLNVSRDGEEVESFPLATNQVLPSGETELSARYIPAETWEPGVYTFEIIVSAVDPEGGTETVLATIEADAEIVVP